MRSRPDECVLSTLLEFIIGKWESRQHHGDFTLRGLHGAVYGLRLMDSRNKFVIKLLSLLEVELMKLNDVQSAVESSTLSRSQSTTNLLLSVSFISLLCEDMHDQCVFLLSKFDHFFVRLFAEKCLQSHNC